MAMPAWLSDRFGKLPGWLRQNLPADDVAFNRIEKLAGGAIQENWLLDIEITGGPRAGHRRWVLRTGAPSSLAVSHGRAEEFAILEVARRAGVMAPEPILLCADPEILGDAFMIVAWAPGISQGRRIARDPELPGYGAALAAELGRQLAMLHKIAPPSAELSFLGDPPADPARARIARYRALLDAIGESRPVLEYALNWLEDRAPAPGRVVFCHVDLRTGNYLVSEGKLTAILDWEFSGWSDADEDLGWFCARCWRFGALTREAGGIAAREDFYGGYEAEAGRTIDRGRIGYWEVMAHVRWAVIALQQEHRHLSGREPSLELALTGRMVPEIEHDLLTEIATLERASPKSAAHSQSSPSDREAPHRRGSAMAPERKLARLLNAVEVAVHDYAEPRSSLDERYAAAMIARALSLAARELEGGIDAPERALNARVYGEELRSLDRLARDLRRRALNDANRPDLPALLSSYVEERVKRWNPRFLKKDRP